MTVDDTTSGAGASDGSGTGSGAGRSGGSGASGRPDGSGTGRSGGSPASAAASRSGAGAGAVHPTPLHAVDHTAEPTDDPLAIRLEQLILGAERRYTPFQAARTAGVSMELASRFWRAMGFADIGQARALTEADVLALRRLAGLVEAGLLSEPMAIQVARSTGQTTARLAEWQIDSFLEGLTEPPEPGMTRTEVTYPLIELLLPELQEFLVYVWRRQLAAATGRVVQAADDEEMVDRRLAIGFADLVGFTRLTRRLEEEELGELVEIFETTAADLVAAHGGRLIKTLGDEVLYAADDAGTASEIALRLIDAMNHDDAMPSLRVGLAFGTVTTRMGDVFGTTVNLASRLTSIAPKDTILVDGAFALDLIRAGDAPKSETQAAEEAATAEKEGEPPPPYRYALQPMWQRPVRGLGIVEPWMLSRRT
ncbi:adenylate/guanylate cyclase domain-containing protein [Streptomyces sp. SID5473]|uniref:Adenylate/guanylate cyclase domain-containing protein n=1 Tax=Streptomyces tsukubensis (strain DSM 42081 / NBRC 108919 / NRRL 18488 / 9993) TaxID=1114943 RepID=I2N506_STRT9|nr:adenylate/guanylate cyclase domain-containing protein [Streptomyces tsukubensis]EIF92103.1 adenylate cyclase [Streptomyces tsukubensis NRRL18488]MYS67743.1 adenylate/guanylate cyclase domain-containing protein [Streptomyces sp. SID5473]QKM67852.1 adenylate/guanylate cyclase domain-containing protein [Streptomyces tsukubensis NRRL18488]TAI44246.1 adenylate/guanylate cyclase domain-containing protein [Streptomyces tsukubensis]